MENEMMTLTDADLDLKTGFGGSFKKEKLLTIDNGTDLTGNDATGQFIYKEREADKSKRIAFKTPFQGVVFASRAFITAKGAKKTWQTNEFNPLEVDSPIPVFQLSEGKRVKDEAGNFRMVWTTPKRLKQQYTRSNADGSKQSDYEYSIILYVYTHEEVVKIKFKGEGRGNWWNYSNQLQNSNILPYTVLTEFSIYKTERVKYAIKFTNLGESPFAPEVVRNERISLIKTTEQQSKNLPPIENDTIQKKEELPSPEIEEEIVIEDVF
jgi:hypothetical protein